MSAATVSEPFLLSSYPESSAHKKRKLAPLYASLPSGSNADPFVTVAVQGDGIHVLDVLSSAEFQTSTLHPAVSHTLGPSAAFSCSPATRVGHNKTGSQTCTTYAVLDSGADVQPEGKGKTVIAWEEDLSGGMSSNARREMKKRVAVTSHTIAHIYASDCIPDRVVLVSSTGGVSIADEELRVHQTASPQHQLPSTLVKHFLFPANSCSFLASHSTAAHRAISVSVLRSGDVLRLNVIGISVESLSFLGECAVPVEETDILDASCSSSGFISVLLASGSWLALTLTSSPTSSLTISQAAEPLRLQNLTFINATRTSEVSITALTSSHVLLSAITIGSVSEVVLLLWDLRYGVLLAQQSIPVPSTLPRPKKHGAILKLQTSPAAQKTGAVQLNALLALLPFPERDTQGDASARSTLLVIPLTVPATSTIAAAMGKANAGARWLSTRLGPNAQAQGQTVRGAAEMSAGARKALREIKAAVDGSANGSTSDAESAYFEYIKQQSKGKAAAQGQEVESQGPLVEYPFVQGLLELVLHAPASAQGSSSDSKTQKVGAYSAKIVTHLLENRMVSSSMVEGGLLPALEARNDWHAVSLAMRTVTDLPEDDIMSLLKQVVAAHLRTAAADEDAMQVDSASVPSTTPALSTFLAQCVVYPSTPALQRTAIRKHLPDAADLTPVLDILDKWIVQQTADGALATSLTDRPEQPTDVPPVDKILAFVQTLLDASFLALLAHTPAHKLLRTLAAHIQPAIASAGELELLCGPLEPFARATAAKAKAQTEAKDKGDSGKDWRRKRRMAHEQAGMAVGLYQVEELVL
ncbi:hypothetical protein C8Q80DRAFT_1099341 [Daedaleopsis nitida]|nr:hypothetical protein C8Q80DRAFT_1099341 [Daedaleopsis nitida]